MRMNEASVFYKSVTVSIVLVFSSWEKIATCGLKILYLYTILVTHAKLNL